MAEILVQVYPRLADPACETVKLENKYPIFRKPKILTPETQFMKSLKYRCLAKDQLLLSCQRAMSLRESNA